MAKKTESETVKGYLSDTFDDKQISEPESKATTGVFSGTEGEAPKREESKGSSSKSDGEEAKDKEIVKTKEITEELIETFEKEEYFDIEDEAVTPEIPPTEKIEQLRAERKKEKSGAAIYAERFSSNPNSVYDRLSGTKQSDSSKGRKSSNLFELIGLNDKFLFIREIFNGDSDLYNTAINRLNNANTFTEANKIIFDYVDDEKDEAYITLLDLVKRKFSVNG